MPRRPGDDHGRAEDDGLDDGQAADGVVDAVLGQAGDQQVPVLAGRDRHPVVAEIGQLHRARGRGRTQRRDRGPVRSRHGFGPAHDADRGQPAAGQPRAQRAGLLADHGLELVIVGVAVAGMLQRQRVTLARVPQPSVELVEQEAMQRNSADDGHDGTGGQQQGQQHRHQPGAQAQPLEPRGHPGPALHGTGLSTYPTPRTVWITGTRPLSIFLRR